MFTLSLYSWVSKIWLPGFFFMEFPESEITDSLVFVDRGFPDFWFPGKFDETKNPKNVNLFSPGFGQTKSLESRKSVCGGPMNYKNPGTGKTVCGVQENQKSRIQKIGLRDPGKPKNRRTKKSFCGIMGIKKNRNQEYRL